MSGGGTNTVLAWYAGTNWLVLLGCRCLLLPVLLQQIPPQLRVDVCDDGIGVSFTPELPRVIVTIDGQITNSLNGGETDAQLMWGIGGGPGLRSCSASRCDRAIGTPD